jgi:hypothetical protein
VWVRTAPSDEESDADAHQSTASLDEQFQGQSMAPVIEDRAVSFG